MEHIPYFDAHCDTIYRCLRTGAQLRENNAHLDLHRASSFGRFAQVFALYQDPEEVPRGSTMVGRPPASPAVLQEMEQNRDVIVPCRTGAEVDQSRGRRENGGDSLHRGRAHRLRPGTGGDGGGMGRAVSQPRVEFTNVLSGTNCRDTDRGLSLLAPTFCGSWRRAISAPTCPTSATRGSGTWCAWPQSRWWPPTPTAGPVPPPAQSHRRHVPSHPGLRRCGGAEPVPAVCGSAGTMEELVAMWSIFLELGGEKTLCLGGDLDGCEELAAGMQGVQDMPRLWQALAAGAIPRPCWRTCSGTICGG